MRRYRTYQMDAGIRIFDYQSFRLMFDDWRATRELTVKQAEQKLAEELYVTGSTIHSWRMGSFSPMGYDLIECLANKLGVCTNELLKERNEERVKMEKLSEYQVEAVYRVYTSVIDYLYTFNETDGFNEYWPELSKKNPGATEFLIDCLLDERIRAHLRKVEKALLKERMFLRSTAIYQAFWDYTNTVLIDIYDGKTSYAYRFEAYAENDGPYTSEDYEMALTKLDEIMDTYFKTDQ